MLAARGRKRSQSTPCDQRSKRPRSSDRKASRFFSIANNPLRLRLAYAMRLCDLRDEFGCTHLASSQCRRRASADLHRRQLLTNEGSAPSSTSQFDLVINNVSRLRGRQYRPCKHRDIARGFGVLQGDLCSASRTTDGYVPGEPGHTGALASSSSRSFTASASGLSRSSRGLSRLKAEQGAIRDMVAPGDMGAAEGHCRRYGCQRNDLRAAEMRLLQCVRPQPRGRLRRPGASRLKGL